MFPFILNSIILGMQAAFRVGPDGKARDLECNERQKVPPSEAAPMLVIRHHDEIDRKRTRGYFRPYLINANGQIEEVKFSRRESYILLAIAILANYKRIPFRVLLTRDDGELFVRYFILFYGGSASRNIYRERYKKIVSRCGSKYYKQEYIDFCSADIKKHITATGNHLGFDPAPFVPNKKRDFLRAEKAVLQLPEELINAAYRP